MRAAEVAGSLMMLACTLLIPGAGVDRGEVAAGVGVAEVAASLVALKGGAFEGAPMGTLDFGLSAAQACTGSTDSGLASASVKGEHAGGSSTVVETEAGEGIAGASAPEGLTELTAASPGGDGAPLLLGELTHE